MATQTYEIASAGNAAGQICRMLLEYDDATMRATAVRVVNESDDPAYAEVVRLLDGRKYSAIFLANTNTAVNIPPGVQTRITVSFHPSGDLIGYKASFLFPYRP